MIRGNAAPFRVIEDRRGTRLIDDVVPFVFEVRLLLLPEEEDAEAGHQGRKLVGDVLQDLGFFLECGDERGFEVYAGLGHGERG